MFQAILNSKVRNNFGNGEADLDWRSIYKQTEDFLTAAVFCRLTYLPGQILWSIICNAVSLTIPAQGLPSDAGQLRQREFWPRWELLEGGAIIGRRELDVYLGFEKIHLLVEAKLGDDSRPQQTPDQWAAEIAAYLHRQDRDSSVPVGLLAIGGMGREPNPDAVRTQWKTTQDLLANRYHHPNATVLLVACSWQSLLKALVETMKSEDIELNISLQYLIFDLIDVLRFHGIRNTHWLTELSQLDPALRKVSDDTVDLLGAWARGTQTMALAERHPWFIAPALRGLDDQSINIFGRMIHV